MYFYIRFLIDFDDKSRSLLLIELYNFVVLPKYEIDDILLDHGLFAC